MSVQQINILIQKTSDYDKDERYMATNDLCNHLAKDVKVDEQLEKKICAAILKQLDDKSNDVQSVAVKCLGILIKKVQPSQILDISEKLCTLMLEGPKELRDIYSIGLKTLISDCSEEAGCGIAKSLAKRLLLGIDDQVPEDVCKESLDNLSDLLRRFGKYLSSEHDSIMQCVSSRLHSDKPIIRKYAATCLSNLAAVISESSLDALVNLVLLMNTTSTTNVRTQIQTFGALSKTVGHRLGKYLDKLISLFLQSCGDSQSDEQHSDDWNELREYCFQGLESFILNCRKEVTPYVKDILGKAVEFMQYDPNYCYDECGEMMEEYEDDYDNDYNASDDDDNSWKVRKVAIRVIQAVVSSRYDILTEVFDSYVDVILDRFKEREETVCLDVIACCTTLLNSAAVCIKESSIERADIQSRLRLKAPLFVNTCSSFFQESRTNKISCKVGLLSMLKALVNGLQSEVDDFAESFLIWIDVCIKDKNITMRLDSIILLKTFFEVSTPTTIQNNFPVCRDLSLNAIEDSSQKVVVEGLKSMSHLFSKLQLSTGESLISSNDLKEFAQTAYQHISKRFNAMDIDQEIKEYSVISMGKLWFYLSAYLDSGLVDDIISVVMKKIENETTRLVGLRMIHDIATKVSLCNFSTALILSIIAFLRHQQRSLRLQALVTLDSILLSSNKLSADCLGQLMGELLEILDESDIVLVQFCLQVIDSSVKSLYLATEVQVSFVEKVYPKLLSVLGHTSHTKIIFSIQTILSSCSQALVSLLPVDKVLADLKSTIDDSSISLSNIAKTEGFILQKCDDTLKAKHSLTIADDAVSVCLNGAYSRQSLLTIYAVGYFAYFNPNLVSAFNESLFDTIMEYGFNSNDEDCHIAVSLCLGMLVSSQMQPLFTKLLGFFIQYSQDLSHVKRILFLLNVLKESIFIHLSDSRVMFVSSIRDCVDLLLKLSTLTEEMENCRNLISECLGLFVILDEDTTLQVCKSAFNSNQSDINLKSTLISSYRFSVSRQNEVRPGHVWLSESVSFMFSQCQSFYSLGESLELSKACLLFVNNAIHHKPELFVSCLPMIVPMIYSSLEFKQERVVDLGPFKHKVDEGLPVRKAGCNIIESILDNYSENQLIHVVDFASLLIQILPLLQDKDEIKISIHQIVIKLGAVAPITILNQIETLIEKLDKSVVRKPIKEGQSTTDIERGLELVRSSCRVIHALSEMPDFVLSSSWQTFVEKLKQANVDLDV